MIFKVQRPITTNENPPVCLVYNEDQTIVDQVQIPEDDYEKIFGTGYKIYCEAKLNKGSFTIIKKVDDQDW